MFIWQQYARTQPHDIALRDFSQGAVFTWEELNQLISTHAVKLRENGVGLISIIAIQGRNHLDYITFYLAALSLGMRVLGLNPAFSREKSTALCLANQVELLIDLSHEQPEFVPFFSGERISIPMMTFKEGTKSDDVELNPVNIAVEYARTFTLTSGSTGLPKAVIHDISAHLENAKGVCELMDFNAQSSWLLSLPLYHVSGQGIVWRWLLQGAELHLPSQNFYEDCLQASHLSLVPTQAWRLLELIEHKDKSAVAIQAILLGGTAIAPELTQKLLACGIQVYVGYGMTEMASTVFAKKCDGKLGVGKPLLGREFRIVDDEIWLRGAGMGRGYFVDGKRKPFVNDQGWFQTKDLAEWDGENLLIHGRKDNMFISGGENIQPEEIETLLLQHHHVNQVYVVPKDDQEFGQRPVAFVEFLTDFNESAVENLRIWLSGKIEKFKQPVAYFPLQKQDGGQIKISRHELIQQVTQYIGK